MLFAMLGVAACHASPNSEYYALSAEDGSEPVNMVLSNVTLPGLLDRPQIILKSGPNDITILEYKRWAEPLDTMIKRVLAEDLNASISHPPANAQQLSVSIDEFDADTSGSVVLRAHWTVRSTRHAFAKSESVDSGDTDAIVAAMSRLLNDLAGAIRHQS
jgi:hypothetical protein